MPVLSAYRLMADRTDEGRFRAKGACPILLHYEGAAYGVTISAGRANAGVFPVAVVHQPKRLPAAAGTGGPLCCLELGNSHPWNGIYWRFSKDGTSIV